MIPSQLVRLASQHLDNSHFRVTHSINSNRESSVSEICNCNHLTLLPSLPVLLIRNSNAVIGADQAEMPDLCRLDALAQRQPIAIDFAFEDSHDHLDFLLSEQVLEMGVGVEDSLDDQYHCEFCMEVLDGCLVIHLDEDVAVVALLEAVVVVLPHRLKGPVLVLDRQQQRNVRQASIGRFFIDVHVALLKKQRVVHDDGLVGKVHPDLAITQLKPNEFLPITLFHYQPCIKIQSHPIHPNQLSPHSALTIPSALIFYKRYYISTKHMRLQFQLNKIKIDPVCHIQILRHAE